MLLVMFKQVLDQCTHYLFCRLKVGQASSGAFELFNRLLSQPSRVGRGSHRRLLQRRKWWLVRGGRPQPGTVWHGGAPVIMMHERLQRDTRAPAFLLEFRLW